MSQRPKLRVLVADDSVTVRHALSQVIGSQPDMEIVATVASGTRAVEEAVRLRPDLITMDVSMPGIDGVEATSEIMRRAPTPIVVVTALDVGPTSTTAFRALSAGAIDVVAKPDGALLKTSIAYQREFLGVLRALGRASAGQSRASARARAGSTPLPADSISERPAVSLVAIGASTGGPQCLRIVLGKIRPGEGPPVAVVQHMSQELIGSFVGWLDSVVSITVSAVRDGERLEGGRVYIAPGGCHLEVDRNLRARLVGGPSVQYQLPAVDPLFNSVAANVGASALGVLLTGMGRDGAAGLLRMREAGCQTVAQNQESCVVFGMPKAAVESGAAQRSMAPAAIAQWLSRLRVRDLSQGGPALQTQGDA